MCAYHIPAYRARCDQASYSTHILDMQGARLKPDTEHMSDIAYADALDVNLKFGTL
jgi:hypothetical protein